MESIESANNVLQQRVNILESTVSEQEHIIAMLQAIDNTTADRLQTVETDLQTMETDLGDVEVEVQG